MFNQLSPAKQLLHIWQILWLRKKSQLSNPTLLSGFKLLWAFLQGGLFKTVRKIKTKPFVKKKLA